jgi:hydrophobe/amphiphile efflux-1 (HAE1) family protein
MTASALFIRRPAATTLLAAGILLLGALCLARLPIASLPAVERPTIAVSASLPGASADTIASALSQPLETQLGKISGIIEMASFSASGGTQIIVQFDLQKDLGEAAGEVQAAINAAAPNLPSNLPSPPTLRKANPSGFAPIAIALTSDVLSPAEVYDYADTVLAQRLSEIPGVARAHVAGAEKAGIRIQADLQRMTSMMMSLEQVRLAVRSATQNLPTGSINAGERTYTVRLNDQLTEAADYGDLTVAYRNGAPVRLRDIANIRQGAINDRLAAWYGGEPAVLVFALKQPYANVVEIVDQVKALLPQVAQLLPPAIKLHVLYDRTALIRASLSHVEISIALAILMVILVMALFLKRIWATLIPSFTIPVVLAGTFVFMNVAGYSLDNLSLMAIIIAIGFIVDDAVIIIENVMRLMNEGHDAATAALEGIRRMGFTVISITAALLGALLPVFFMPDVVGRYFREFAMTLAAAIIMSAIVSLTLTPMLCSRLLRQQPPPGPAERTEQSSRVLQAYLRSLDWILARPVRGFIILALALVGSVALYQRLPKGFMPTQDTGVLSVRTITTANISFAAMEQLEREATEIVSRDPAVDSVSSFIGTDNGTSLSTGTMYVVLKSPEVRNEAATAVIDRLRKSLAGVSGIRSFFTPWQDLELGVQSTPGRYQYTLTGIDPDELWRWSEIMQRRMAAMPEIADVISSAERAGLEAGLVIDRERAAAFGVTPVTVDNTLYDAFGQRWATIMYLPSNSSEVVLEADPALQSDPSIVRSLFVPAIGGTRQVPLSALTRMARSHAPMWIRHNGQFPSITLSFDLRAGISIGDALVAIRTAQAEIHMPDDIKAEFRGEADTAAKTRATQLSLTAGAVLAVYVVLGILYESFALAFVVLATLPSATFGGLLALTVTRSEFSVIAAIACILVVGLAMKNAIIMVDFAVLATRHQGLSPREAIRYAAEQRARPIVMTSIVAVLIALPLAISSGAGYELRQPLGIATVGGLAVSLLVTLYTTPAIYLLIDRRRWTASSPAHRI